MTLLFMKKIILTIISLALLGSCGGWTKDISLLDVNKLYDTETQSIDLSGVGLEWEVDIAAFLGEEISREIQSIDLSHNKIDSIVWSEIPRIKFLDLSDNQLDNTDIQKLPKIRLNKTHLDISGNDISKNILDALQAKMDEHHGDVK